MNVKQKKVFTILIKFGKFHEEADDAKCLSTRYASCSFVYLLTQQCDDDETLNERLLSEQRYNFINNRPHFASPID